MSNRAARDEFIVLMTQEGLPLEVTRKILRHATTLHRLAEAQCNGDWPADNGERKTKECPVCGSYFVPSIIKRYRPAGALRTGFYYACLDCRTSERVRAVLPKGFTALFSGDPRGAVLKIKVPSGHTNDWGQTGICVP